MTRVHYILTVILLISVTKETYGQQPGKPHEGEVAECWMLSDAISALEKDYLGDNTPWQESLPQSQLVREKARDNMSYFYKTLVEIYKDKYNNECPDRPEANNLNTFYEQRVSSTREDKREIKKTELEVTIAPAKPDSCNLSIRQTQEALKKLGYNPGSTDGVLGRKTEHAIISFQKDNEIIATGVLDEITRDKLCSMKDDFKTNPASDMQDKIAISNSFTLSDIEICSISTKTDITIRQIGGLLLHISGNHETVFAGGGFQRLDNCDGAIHRIVGTVVREGLGFEKYTFIGEEDDPLVFQCVHETGYIYVGGKGRVIINATGEEKRLGY